MASEGSALDTFEMTLTLDNRQSLPVTLSTIDLVHISSVRANGAEMGAGSIVLPHTYNVQPGRTSFTLGASDYVTTYHGFGSPVVAFKLTGEVRVANSAPDINARSLYCSFSDVEMGSPLRGYWGS